MTATSVASGTQTATINTEHTLYSGNVAGVFEAYIDLTNMAAGDVVELRWKTKIITGGTAHVGGFARFAGAQPADDAIAVWEAITNLVTDSGSIVFTLKQTAGTGRNYDFNVVKHA